MGSNSDSDQWYGRSIVKGTPKGVRHSGVWATTLLHHEVELAHPSRADEPDHAPDQVSLEMARVSDTH